MQGRRGHRRGATRSRRLVDGQWQVRARIERFVEPALLLLLAEGPLHGYDLLERVTELTGESGGLDLGNLYRVLRAMEADGLVCSEWHAELQGPAKRVYELTDDGREVLATWADALASARSEIDAFLSSYRATEGR